MMSDKIYIILLFITIGVKILNIIFKRCKECNNRHDKLIKKVINITSLISKLFFIYNIYFLIINYNTGDMTIAILYFIIKILLTICIYIYNKLDEESDEADDITYSLMLASPLVAGIIILEFACLFSYTVRITKMLLQI